MKRYLQVFILSTALFISSAASYSQQVNTLYFLENAPMRHLINPAFQPVSNFYMTFPVVGYTSFWVGNNALSLSDLVFKNANGEAVTALHPSVEGELWKKLPNMINLDANIHIDLFSFGWRIRNNGFAHFNIAERIDMGVGMPKSMFANLLGQDLNTINLSSLHVSASMYTDIALGYSHRINSQWTVGGKLKVLLGHAYISGNFDNLQFNSSTDIATLVGTGNIQQAGIIKEFIANNGLLPELSGVQDTKTLISRLWHYCIPSGYGGAVDLGVTYKPLPQLQITAAVTDLGMMHWHTGSAGQLRVDTTFTGFGNFEYNDFVYNDEFQSDSLISHISNNLKEYSNAIHHTQVSESPFNQMLNAKLNVGIDANFWKNRIGLGVYSQTRFLENRINEEVTIGAAFRPFNWFNLAASYSFLNGKWSNVGAAVALAPYDGFMFTVAADYVPLSYAPIPNTDIYAIPYKTKGFNLAVGITIVAGTNNRNRRTDKDKDGVLNVFDACPNTPANVFVDQVGCPLDSDGDGVPDYMDECPNTISRAYEMVDSVGCPMDSDRDGVADYLDQCPNTLPEDIEFVDETGCVADSDGDGIGDNIDRCPSTPVAAYDQINEYGCPLDSDGDGVADYEDRCPNTPAEAKNKVDKYGCPLDSDGDGIADYMDQCPNTIEAARYHVNEEGCLKDTDGDGIYDYEDACPTLYGKSNTSGCPEITKEIRRILNKAMRGIQFENGKATIKPTSYPILDEVVKVFLNNPAYIIEVQGHTDNVGNYDYNVQLSESRAQAVRSYIVEKGVEPERITAHGYGPDRPITTNDTKEGRALNRRVAFNITFEEVLSTTTY